MVQERNGFRCVSRLGMGCWAIGGHGWGVVNDKDSVRAVNYALEHGIDFFDTADAYGLGKSETLLAHVLGSKRHDVIIATKGGVKWDETGKIWTDISPRSLSDAVENSLRRLKLDTIPLYYIHKPDGVTCIEESVATLERFREEGKIRAIGVSNFTPEQLIKALEVTKVNALQVRLNLLERHVLDSYSTLCVENGIKFIAWGVLSDGLLTGKFSADTVFGSDDHRSKMPDFIGYRYKNNLKCISSLSKFAADRGVTLSQLALRWVLDTADFLLPLFGAKTDLQVKDNLGVLGWQLSIDDIREINSMVDEIKEDA